MFLSIMGMYDYDPSVFNGLSVPEGVEKDAVITEICLQCAELEVVYPDIDTMKLAITVWSLSNQHTWEKLYNTMNLEYNPIWNVDADVTEEHVNQGETIEEVRDNESRDILRNDSGSDNRTVDITDTVNITDTESVQGFNSSSWADSKKNVQGGTNNHAGTDNHALANQSRIDDDVSRTGTRSNSSDNTSEVNIRRTGNIGVTTTQQMIAQERDIAEFSIINYITQSFKERFCLLIY